MLLQQDADTLRTGRTRGANKRSRGSCPQMFREVGGGPKSRAAGRPAPAEHQEDSQEEAAFPATAARAGTVTETLIGWQSSPAETPPHPENGGL